MFYEIESLKFLCFYSTSGIGFLCSSNKSHHCWLPQHLKYGDNISPHPPGLSILIIIILFNCSNLRAKPWSLAKD